MQEKSFRWLGSEFLLLSSEGEAGTGAADQAAGIFTGFEQRLGRHGLSLDDTVRTRLWAGDRDARNQASRVRADSLTGPARAAGSSYIAPDRFETGARVAFDLLALRPAPPGDAKTVREYDPPRTPLRYLVMNAVVVLSGVSSGLDSLADQVNDVLAVIGGSLADAGTAWRHAAMVSFYLHDSCTIGELDALFDAAVEAPCPGREYVAVAGYSSPGKLIEIEVTATLPR